MKEFVLTVLGVLVLVCTGAQWFSWRSKSQLLPSLNANFSKFQKLFLAPYLLAVFADWLQGPYVYKLYSQYGYSPKEIALLYIVGFGSSLLLGTFTGPLADRFGRKRACLAFCFVYSFCCLTKLSPNFWMLFVGRLLGGIATSVLFSTFESWYICQHSEHHNFPAEWISTTFSTSTFWNSISAILAGLVADLGADWLGFGPVAPFMTAIPFLMLSAIFISVYWTENDGGVSRQSISLGRSAFEGLRVIFQDRSIFLLGLVQSCFESVMYIFVFLWTPVLESPDSPWPLGLVFSCFMVCIMIGSSANNLLIGRGVRPSTILLAAVFCSSLSMMICAWSTSSAHRFPVFSFLAFLLLEVAVGMYFPAIGYLRSQVIPETLRANIMNWFRAPLNLITCTVLYFLHRNDDNITKDSSSHDDQNAFFFNVGLTAIGLVASVTFRKSFSDHDSKSCKTNGDKHHEEGTKEQQGDDRQEKGFSKDENL